jgi:hypothetical protein
MDVIADALPRSSKQPPRLERVAFRGSRLLEFCSEKELTLQTGHEAQLWPLVVAKELIDNAIDACEEVGVAPVVTLKVDDATIEVEDNGPGLPATTLDGVLDYTVRASSREAYVSPTRGAQGNALKTVLAMPYALAGSAQRGRVEIEAHGLRHTIEFAVDHVRQEPVIRHETQPFDREVGTLVRVHWPVSPRSQLGIAEPRFLQIVDDFAWLNPHLTLTLTWYGARNGVEATTPGWVKWLPSDPTPPHWYECEHLQRLIGAYLKADQDAGRELPRTVREFISEFRGLSGSAKQKVVLEATGCHVSHCPSWWTARTSTPRSSPACSRP